MMTPVRYLERLYGGDIEIPEFDELTQDGFILRWRWMHVGRFALVVIILPTAAAEKQRLWCEATPRLLWT